MLLDKIKLNIDGEVIKNQKVLLECELCKRSYFVAYSNYKKKVDKYKSTPCKSCIQKNRHLNHVSKNPRYNLICDVCNKKYSLSRKDYENKIEKYNKETCGACLTSLRQKGKTLEEQWGKETSDKAKKRISKTLSGRVGVNKGLKWTELQKENLKKVRPTKGKTLEELYGYEKAIQIKKNMSKATSGKNNPMYGKPSPQGSGNGWSGWYNEWFFRSLLELSYMINVIEKNNLEWKSGELKEYSIPYILENKERTYHCDFIIENTLKEIKPTSLLNSKIVLIKKEAAEKWCLNNGYSYKIESSSDFSSLSKEEIKRLYDLKLIKFTKRYEKKYKEYIE